MMRFEYHRPRSLDDALRLKAGRAGARFVAGGTDLLVRMKCGLESHPSLISLRSVPGLVGIEENGSVRIGALTTLTDILEHSVLRDRTPVLAQAVAAIGNQQIRNVATIGGNLCNAAPCADTALALLVLDAKLSVLGDGGERDIPIDRFFLGPRQTVLNEREIVTAILLDPPPRQGRGCFLKKRRVSRDLALASVAVYVEMSGKGGVCQKVRVAAGSVAPKPLRLEGVEGLLEGQRLTPDVLSAAQARAREEILPISDVRTTADYRRHITGVLLKRAVEAAATRGRA
jgi:carbon-monoxide dehydrogenase medium subunit